MLNGVLYLSQARSMKLLHYKLKKTEHYSCCFVEKGGVEVILKNLLPCFLITVLWEKGLDTHTRVQSRFYIYLHSTVITSMPLLVHYTYIFYDNIILYYTCI